MSSYKRLLEAMSIEDRAAHIAWARDERRQTEIAITSYAVEVFPDKVERAYFLASLDQSHPYPSLLEEIE